MSKIGGNQPFYVSNDTITSAIDAFCECLTAVVVGMECASSLLDNNANSQLINPVYLLLTSIEQGCWVFIESDSIGNCLVDYFGNTNGGSVPCYFSFPLDWKFAALGGTLFLAVMRWLILKDGIAKAYEEGLNV